MLTHAYRQRGFSLVELTVVSALSERWRLILMPAIAHAREQCNRVPVWPRTCADPGSLHGLSNTGTPSAPWANWRWSLVPGIARRLALQYPPASTAGSTKDEVNTGVLFESSDNRHYPCPNDSALRPPALASIDEYPPHECSTCSYGKQLPSCKVTAFHHGIHVLGSRSPRPA